MTNYQVLVASTADDLKSKVESMFTLGFITAGGVSVVAVPNGFMFCQAVIK